MMLQNIARRTHNTYVMQAQLHGIRIPFKHNPQSHSNDPIELTAKEEELIAKSMAQAQARIRARHGR